MGLIIFTSYDQLYAMTVSFSDDFKPYAKNSLFVSVFAWGLAKSFDAFLVMESSCALRITMSGMHVLIVALAV